MSGKKRNILVFIAGMTVGIAAKYIFPFLK